MTRHLLTVTALVLLMPACQADQNGSSINVSGTVYDQPFDAMSGVAEYLDGQYFVTLSDDPNFTCTSSPAGDYLTVEMFNVGGSGSYDAVGNVTFNEIVSDVVDQQAAESGSFDVTVIDDGVGGELLQGTIRASGQTSSVSGSFEVPVCE